MDNLDWLRVTSIAALAVWCGAAAAVLPAILKAHPYRHPVLLLLLILCVLEVAEGVFFVDTAFTSTGPRQGRAFFDVVMLRVVSVTGAAAMAATIWYTMRDRR